MNHILLFFGFSLLSLSAFSKDSKTFELKNKISFFTQEVMPEHSLPQRLSELKDIKIEFLIPSDLPMPSLRKVYNSEFHFNGLSFKISVFHFYQNKERYLSQQIAFYRNQKLIARCTSYFPESQGFLVPGVCSGVDEQMVWGLSIFKG